jgi:hypothetical protein
MVPQLLSNAALATSSGNALVGLGKPGSLPIGVEKCLF